MTESEKEKTEAAGAEPKPAGAEDEAEAAGGGFPIVGIGASAGGLAAFEAFFSGMPADTDPGMAFVLVQHLAPDHKSILTELIRRYTRMKVFEVEDGMRVRPNHAYIIPPNRDMAFLNGCLQLMEPAAPRGRRMPIDFFFRSLALDQRERAICVVLSGTGSDGALGVRAIKGEGGMAMAQNPESTEYDGMPRSAIDTGLVDYQLPPAEMAAQIIAYVAHAFGRPPKSTEALPVKSENALNKIFILVRVQTGHDFSQYKSSTVNRRIQRRMAVNQIDEINAYVRYLRRSPAEVDALFRDLLIGVTSFFRDPEAFKALEELAVPKLFDGKPPDGVIRAWSTGCSTGEEAYSLAILLAERQEALKRNFRVQVFATDIDSRAIAAARAGVFPASIAADVPPERLARHFSAETGGDFRIQKGIRDMLVFSEQDVAKDPPFSGLDLISCRNLLIYMGGNLQNKLIPLFHYALNPGGFLFLGTSESVGGFNELFSSLDRKSKLYQRKGESSGAWRSSPVFPTSATQATAAFPPTAINAPGPWKPSLRELIERALLRQIAPAAALIEGNGDILYLHGRTGLYLEPAPGETGMSNILKMAREGLRRDLTTALHKASTAREDVRRFGLRVKTNGDLTSVDLLVHPVVVGPNEGIDTPLYLVVLEGAKPRGDLWEHPIEAPAARKEAAGPDADADARIAALKRELLNKEEYLQATNEELETSNEELKSSNEEMQSMNEELQSSNEELETSKEELQSVNEELATVNAELQTKVSDLSRANNDMNNLMAGSGIGTVFVDHGLRILRFTPAITRTINLIQTDIGRPVGHILSNLTGYATLSADIQAVLDTLIPKEIEVRAGDEAWYLMRIQPYRTLHNVIEGAVITFVDITASKQSVSALEACEREKNAIVKEMFDAFASFDAAFDDDGALAGCRFTAVNPAFERMMGVAGDQIRGRTVKEIWPGDEAAWMDACERAAGSGAAIRFEMGRAPDKKKHRCNVFCPGGTRERFFAVFDEIAEPERETT